MTCSPDPAENLAKAVREGAGGRAGRRADRLPAGAVPLAVLLPRGGRGDLRPGRADSGAVDGGARGRRRERPAWSIVALAVRAARGGPVPQHGGRARRRRRDRGPLPQDAHPGRPALLREVLLHAGRPGFPGLRHAVRADRRRWSAGTSGIRKARGSRRCAGATVLFYPTAIGWHPHEKAEYGAAQRDAWRTIQRGARHRQRHLRGGGEPRRLREAAGGGRDSSSGARRLSPIRSACVVAEASTDQEEILVAEFDPARIEDVRRNWPFLRDRRIDAYGGITRRFLDADGTWSEET